MTGYQTSIRIRLCQTNLINAVFSESYSSISTN